MSSADRDLILTSTTPPPPPRGRWGWWRTCQPERRPSCRWQRSRLGALAALTLLTTLLAPAGSAAEETTPPAPNAFTDDNGSVHEPALNILAERGYLTGTECASKKICPSKNLQRWELAVWLGRVLTDNNEPTAIATSRFADVDPKQWWAPHVERFAELNITKGCETTPLSYCPYNAVTRAQMASFLTRAFSLPSAAAAGFTDIATNPHANAINALAAARITTGCQTTPFNYCPRQSVTRAQMATFIARAQNLIPKPPHTYKTITLQHNGTCGIRTDNTAVCWGNNNHGQTDVPEGKYKTIATSPLGFPHSEHACGILTDNTLTCWGNNYYGQTNVPEGTFKTLALGVNHTCGIRTDYTITCWGGNHSGQSNSPLGTFKTITASKGGNNWYYCGIRTDNTITCWGARTNSPEGTFKTIATGSSHTCGIRTDNTITCWGSRTNSPEGTFKTIATSSYHTCGTRTDNTITCWGDNHQGQAEDPEGTFKAVAPGTSHTCAMRFNNTVLCWGNNNSRKTISPLETFETIVAGWDHSCGISTNNTITCWGLNDYGQTNIPE